MPVPFSRLSGPGIAAGWSAVGFTVPRAFGKAVVRNRIKRRMREAVRCYIDRMNPQWSIVINPRRKALDAPMPELKREVERLMVRCSGS